MLLYIYIYIYIYIDLMRITKDGKRGSGSQSCHLVTGKLTYVSLGQILFLFSFLVGDK